MGNAIHIHHNNFYDNAVGLSADSITAAGHPGYPQDSTLVEHNRIYSNNFNPLRAATRTVDPDRAGSRSARGCGSPAATPTCSATTASTTTGAAGSMLFQVPDNIACDLDTPHQTCSPTQFPEQTNSYRNRFFDNTMGVAPGGKTMPNGVDFWWGNQTPDKNNCWFDNTGVDGTRASVTMEPDPLPSDCQSSAADGPQIHPELIACFLEEPSCTWTETPPRPGGRAADTGK